MQARSPALFPKLEPDGADPHAPHQPQFRRRRGVVLILVIGMLALMALIGVTFATFSGQSQRSSRNFAETLLRPNPQDLVDYALSQLINDSDNPLSAIRGHSLKRDMYGNDGQFNGFIDRHPLTRQAPVINSTVDGGGGTVIVTTNLHNQAIASQGFNFNRWILKLFASTTNREVAQTFEVVDLDLNLSTLARPNSGFVRLQLTPRQVITDPTNPTVGVRTEYGAFLAPGVTGAIDEFNGRPFVLDGRFLNAFNGPGVSTLSVTVDGVNPLTYFPNLGDLNFMMREAAGRHPNFLFNGLNAANIAGVATPVWFQYTTGTLAALGNPDLVGMDEDFDAPDLENWFLAIQSADGKVVVPSFHRPSIIYRDPTDTANSNANTSDWRKFPAATINAAIKNGTITPAQLQTALQTRSKFLRPRKVDNPDWRWKEKPNGEDPVPDANGRIEYDVDNDGDGYREGVWLDLGYSPQRDPQTGKLFKPLFSYTVIGLNGKLPLNTAGNLQARRRFTTFDASANRIQNAGDPTWTHTSHLGFSVSEINPLFALQNAYNPSTGGNNNAGLDLDGNPTLLPTAAPTPGYYSQTDNIGVSVAVNQLRNLLTGTRAHRDPLAPNPAENQDYNLVQTGDPTKPMYVPNNLLDAQDQGPNRPIEATEGRWGEADGVPRVLLDPTAAGFPYYMAFQHLSRAGRSVTPRPSQLPYLDATDDNFTTRDPFPWYDPSQTPPISPESVDMVNPAGTTAAIETGIAGERTIPSERMRYFTTPTDISGNGLVAAKDWNGPVRINGTGGSPIALRPQIQWGTGADRWGRVGHFLYFRPPGVIPASLGVPPNPLHGFDSQRLPAGITDPFDQILHGSTGMDHPHAYGAVSIPTGMTPTVLSPMFLMAGMPFDPNAATPDVAPTFSLDTTGLSSGQDTINSRSSPGVSGAAATYGLNHGSLGKDEADEMNLYAPNSFDAPFTANDLDWLYNTDKAIEQRSSRLAKLAPVSLLNNFDGKQRRKLFSVDTWDLNRFVFAPENPSGAFAFNNRNPGATSYALNGGFRYLLNEPTAIRTVLRDTGLTPALAQSERRIDLNAPLPASVSPLEPIRQKWVLHAYHAAVQVLPPTAVDHPVERAQLSQFLLNIVDFRDPDPVCTVFRNPELVLLPADAARPARTAFADDTRNIPRLSAGAQADDRWSKAVPLEQYGMEHNPIAINEILAFAYQSKATGGMGTENGRLFVELVNTLSRPALLTNPNTGTTNASVDASKLDLNGWDLVILGDADWTTRPDPINGAPAEENIAAKLNYSATATPPTEALNFRTGGSGSTPEFNDPVPALNPYPNNSADNDIDASFNNVPSKHYYVLTNDAPTAASAEENTPPLGNTQRPGVALPQSWVTDNLIDNSMATPPISTARQDKRYHWLYLRRPANPFSPVQPDPTAANYNPWVVMDSFRFAFIEGSGTVDAMNDNANPNGEDIYSLMRRQPYRGGQLIYDHETVFDTDASGNPNPAAPQPRNAYGYSEQPAVTNDTTPNGTAAYRGLWKAGNAITKPIWHTIGQPNDIADEWAYFPFLDRDFASVAELLLVPGCSPGLFTKQFVEGGYRVSDAGNPGNRSVSNDYQTTPPNHNTARNNGGGSLDNPATFPYLPDAFYYTASSPFGRLTDPYDPTHEAKAPASLRPTAPYVAFLNGTPGPEHNPKIGGATGAGWYKLLEFFEVPSSSFGSLGGMAQGENFDWYRQDRRPGQLNLNLIMDEEVFFGLIDDPRLNDTPIVDAVAPRQVTELSSTNGAPAYQTYNRGFLRVWRTGTDAMGNPIFGVKNAKPLANGNPDPNGQLAMSAAFSDFLKLRHGGSGYILGNGAGSVGTNGVSAPITHLDGTMTTVPPEIAEDRYFRSLSFPDINYTVMRPASLPPSTETLASLTANPALVAGDRYVPPATPPAANTFVGDPGQKNPYIEWSNWPGALPPANPVPPIPPRRLWDIPDWFGQPGNASAMPTPTPATHHGSSERGNRNVNLAIDHSPPPATPYFSTPGVMLTNPFSNLFGGLNTLQFADPNDTVIAGYMAPYIGGAPDGSTTPFPYDLNLMEFVRDGGATYDLGGAHLKNDTTKAVYDHSAYVQGDDPDYDGVTLEANYDDPNRGGMVGVNNNVDDRRRHPYFRNEMLQKVMNLTTVRTHQYAVWVTVGFFEVTEEGDAKYLKPDVIGPELVPNDGDPVRFRSFFVVDRTKAFGFNPINPGDFRDCVIYRRKID